MIKLLVESIQHTCAAMNYLEMVLMFSAFVLAFPIQCCEI